MTTQYMYENGLRCRGKGFNCPNCKAKDNCVEYFEVQNELKTRFLNECENRQGDPKYLVVAVKLPNGAIELITNTENIGNKAEYYKNSYDEKFCLKTNPSIQIVGFMMI